MSAEKIIEQIKNDSQNEIEEIISDTKKQASEIVKNIKEETKKESNEMLEKADKQIDSIHKILVSKASQDAKRDITKARESVIEECFKLAQDKLAKLEESKYEKIVTQLLEDGIKKLGEGCTMMTTKSIDRKIAKKLELKVTGEIKGIGGVILKSLDEKIIMDNTFEGILNREKDKIRIEVGKILFE